MSASAMTRVITRSLTQADDRWRVWRYSNGGADIRRFRGVLTNRHLLVCVVALVAGFAAISVGLPGARAQPDPPPAASGEEAVPQTLDDLASAFPQIDWDSKAHGLLLAVAPDDFVWKDPAFQIGRYFRSLLGRNGRG